MIFNPVLIFNYYILLFNLATRMSDIPYRFLSRIRRDNERTPLLDISRRFLPYRFLRSRFHDVYGVPEVWVAALYGGFLDFTRENMKQGIGGKGGGM